MQVFATKKVLDELAFPVGEWDESENPFFSWHTNMITMDRKKVLLFINEINRYTIVLFGVKAKDFKRLDELLVEAIRASFLAEGIPSNVVEHYIEEAGKVSFHKSKNRSMLGSLNQAVDNTWAFSSYIQPDKVINPDLNHRVSCLITGVGYTPYVKLKEDMMEWNTKEIAVRAAVLHVEMELQNHSIWRKFIFPLDRTFADLHKALQIAFRWQDNHLHAFYAEEDGRMIEVSDGEKGVLSDYIPKYKRLKYVYDFGDDWRHVITVEDVIDDYELIYPVCLDGDGETPHEDSGGEPGFDHYINCLNDETHEEHKAMVQWEKTRWFSTEYDPEFINRRLKEI